MDRQKVVGSLASNMDTTPPRCKLRQSTAINDWRSWAEPWSANPVTTPPHSQHRWLEEERW